jgi:Fungal specific transcription factor domain
MIRAGAHLSRTNQGSSTTEWTTGYKEEQAILLLRAAQSFDALAWATALQRHSPHSDLAYRAHIASAHRAAVCIYLSRVLLSISPATELDCNLESLISEVICHLSFIRLGNALFKATTWPTFIAGAETKDPGQQAWVVARLRELWEVEPWGLIRGALGILELIWHRRNPSMQGGASTVDWIQDLRTLGVDWLIV